MRLAEEAGFAKSDDLIGWGPRNVLLLDEKEHVEVDQDDEDCEIDENLRSNEHIRSDCPRHALLLPNANQEDNLNFIKWQLEAKWDKSNLTKLCNYTHNVLRYGGDGSHFSCFVITNIRR